MSRGPLPVVAAGVLLAVGCVPDRGPAAPGGGTPREAALAFVAAAAREDAHALRVQADADAARRDDAGLRDAAAALARWSAPRVSRETRLDDGRTAVDVEADLPGGGIARGSLVAVRGPDGRFRVAAVFAPGAEWPRREPPSGEGLSVSPEPG